MLPKDLSTENPIRSTGSQRKLWFQTPLISMRNSVPNGNKEDVKYLSEWKDQVKELIVECISSSKEKIRSPKQKILNDPDVTA